MRRKLAQKYFYSPNTLAQTKTFRIRMGPHLQCWGMKVAVVEPQRLR